MKTEPKTYQFDNQPVRIVMRIGEPWFVAADICEALSIANSRDAIEKLDADEKGVALTDTLGGNQNASIISESGMYTLILRCRDATTTGTAAHRFRKWVTSEVLPAIRKTGAYAPVRELPHGHVIALERDVQQVLNAANRLSTQYERIVSSMKYLQNDLAELQSPTARLAHAVKFRHLQPDVLRGEVVRVLSKAGKQGLSWARLIAGSKLLKGGKTPDVLTQMIADGEIARLVLPKTVTLYLRQFAPTVETKGDAVNLQQADLLRAAIMNGLKAKGYQFTSPAP